MVCYCLLQPATLYGLPSTTRHSPINVCHSFVTAESETRKYYQFSQSDTEGHQTEREKQWLCIMTKGHCVNCLGMEGWRRIAEWTLQVTIKALCSGEMIRSVRFILSNFGVVLNYPKYYCLYGCWLPRTQTFQSHWKITFLVWGWR